MLMEGYEAVGTVPLQYGCSVQTIQTYSSYAGVGLGGGSAMSMDGHWAEFARWDHRAEALRNAGQ